jgi:hypothetical protein
MSTKEYFIYMSVITLIFLLTGVYMLNANKWELQFIYLFIVVVIVAFLVNLLLAKINKKDK